MFKIRIKILKRLSNGFHNYQFSVTLLFSFLFKKPYNLFHLLNFYQLIKYSISTLWQQNHVYEFRFQKQITINDYKEGTNCNRIKRSKSELHKSIIAAVPFKIKFCFDKPSYSGLVIRGNFTTSLSNIVFVVEVR